jgi:hypothetical protein
MPNEPSRITTSTEVGTPHAPVEHAPDIPAGGPASQHTHYERMPEAFASDCIQSSGSGLKPRATSALPGKIEPGREAPRLIKPLKRNSFDGTD